MVFWEGNNQEADGRYGPSLQPDLVGGTIGILRFTDPEGPKSLCLLFLIGPKRLLWTVSPPVLPTPGKETYHAHTDLL